MPRMMTAREAAEKWCVSERRVTYLCKENQLDGAEKDGKSWLIPEDAAKPADRRIRSGKYIHSQESEKRPLPIGVSDYRLATDKYYTIDKTLLIKDILDERAMVSLFTRPRRFGKTMAMDMLRTFFEKTDEDTSGYFQHRKIWACGQKYRDCQGKYPVIFISFKDVKCPTWADTYDCIRALIRKEFERHADLLDSDAISSYDKRMFRDFLDGNATPNDVMASLATLSELLHKHHGTAPVIIIDEYDTPIQQGHSLAFYNEAVDFMRNLFSGAFKDNRHLAWGFLTGILRIAKESLFSGLNNLKVNTILDAKYCQYFGFTPDEVREMARYYGADDKLPEICEWYDGYRFGSADILNPWSVINYLANDCQPRAYWQSTGSNEIIGELLSTADSAICDKLHRLLQGESVAAYVDTGVIYPQLQIAPAAIFSVLLVAGYLKVLKTAQAVNGDFICEVALPNKEIRYVYNKEILLKLSPYLPLATGIGIQEALYSGDAPALQSHLRQLLLESASAFDTAQETFYHGLLLGLCSLMDNRYEVTSNREAGQERYDICLIPRLPALPGIIIELKAARNRQGAHLRQLAGQALRQIASGQYACAMSRRNIGKVFLFGVAFSGKMVEIATAE